MIVLLVAYGVLYVGALSLAHIILAKALSKRPTLHTDVFLIVAIISLIVAAYVGTRNESIAANFFQHAVGGGFVTGLLTLFTLRNFKLRLPLLAVACLVIASVSVFGIANELLEFLLQSTTSLRFANDIADTWRDLAANTSGALLACALAVAAYRDKRLHHA